MTQLDETEWSFQLTKDIEISPYIKSLTAGMRQNRFCYPDQQFPSCWDHFLEAKHADFPMPLIVGDVAMKKQISTQTWSMALALWLSDPEHQCRYPSLVYNEAFLTKQSDGKGQEHIKKAVNHFAGRFPSIRVCIIDQCKLPTGMNLEIIEKRLCAQHMRTIETQELLVKMCPKDFNA